MTVEEKARAYDEALERAKGIHSFSSDIAEIKRMEQIFPELAESEDERIRKVQLDYWRSVGGKEWHGVPVQETIAWLEKQAPKNKTALDKAIEDEVNAWIEKQNSIKFNDEEDERIRKSIICGMNALKDQKRETFATIPIDDCITWLKKQEEKSTFNKERLMEVAKPETFEEQIEHWQRMCSIAEKIGKELLEKQGKQKPTLRERYENIAQSEWFKRTHEGMSVSDDEESTWTEEDEKYIDNCCLLIGAADDCYEKSFKDDCIHYLQGLKQRMEEL